MSFISRISDCYNNFKIYVKKKNIFTKKDNEITIERIIDEELSIGFGKFCDNIDNIRKIGQMMKYQHNYYKLYKLVKNYNPNSLLYFWINVNNNLDIPILEVKQNSHNFPSYELRQFNRIVKEGYIEQYKLIDLYVTRDLDEIHCLFPTK